MIILPAAGLPQPGGRPRELFAMINIIK